MVLKEHFLILSELEALHLALWNIFDIIILFDFLRESSKELHLFEIIFCNIINVENSCAA